MLCGTQFSFSNLVFLVVLLFLISYAEILRIKTKLYANNSRRASPTVGGHRVRVAHKESGPHSTQAFLCSFERSPAGSLCQRDSGAWQIKGHQHSSSGSRWRSVQTRCRFISRRGFPAAATLEKISRQACRQWDDQSSGLVRLISFSGETVSMTGVTKPPYDETLSLAG